jgi:hypothetical protein
MERCISQDMFQPYGSLENEVFYRLPSGGWDFYAPVRTLRNTVLSL